MCRMKDGGGGFLLRDTRMKFECKTAVHTAGRGGPAGCDGGWTKGEPFFRLARCAPHCLSFLCQDPILQQHPRTSLTVLFTPPPLVSCVSPYMQMMRCWRSTSPVSRV